MTHQPPIAPIPVAPLAWPPAPPPPRRGRPGIVTAMGILSIIVALMSGAANFVVTMMAFALLVGSNAGPRMIVPPMPPPPQGAAVSPAPPGSPGAATAIVGGIPIDPSQSEDGIGEAQRQMVISGMTRARPLDDGRSKQLDLLLTVAGRSMFPFISAGTTPQTIRANVSDFGRLPSASGGKGPDFYIIGTGRVEVYDTHAIFRPDGSPDVVSVTANADDAGNGPAGTGTPPRANPAAAQPMPMPVVTPVPNPMAGINRTAATLSMVEGLLSMVLALYLLIIGILTLRDARNGAKLHWWYVGLKVPLVILAIVANSWLVASFIRGMNATATGMAANTAPGAPPAAQTAAAGLGAMATFWVVILSLAALAYPLSLIVVLLSKTVRNYYKPVRDY